MNGKKRMKQEEEKGKEVKPESGREENESTPAVFRSFYTDTVNAHQKHTLVVYTLIE